VTGAGHTRGRRALILGGSGFMGRALARELLEVGCAVTLVNRGRTGAQ
jgi:nucleoside-diphosphate-sugar epimerase